MKLIVFLLSLSISSVIFGSVRVVTSSQDLKSIAEFIGGKEVIVESLTDGRSDLHFIESRPSMVYKLKNADMVVRIGMDLDVWLDALINASRNKKIMYGGVGYVDASYGIEVLEKPQGKIDASMGDIHIFGNPHYWLDPRNGKIIARNIKDALIKLNPQHKEYFEENYKVFCRKIDEKLEEWKKKLSSVTKRKIITYHNSWIYFARCFNFEIIENIEPKPGIPPTPSHIKRLIEIIRKENVGLIFVDNFYSTKTALAIVKNTDVKIVVLPSSVNGDENVNDYFKLFDFIIEKIISN